MAGVFAGTAGIGLAQNATLYALNGGSASISAFSIAADGGLSPITGSPFSSTGTSPSGMVFDPAGRFAYVTNAGSNHVAAFRVSQSGALSPIGGSPFATGAGPLQDAIDPTGRFLYTACNGSNSISAFTIDSSTGVLTPVSGSPFTATLGIGAWDLAIDATGRFLYVANSFGNGISGFAIDPSTGGLTPLAGSPMGSGFFLPIRISGNLLFTAAQSLLFSFTVGPGGSLTAAPGSPYAVGALAEGLAVDPAGRFVYVTGIVSNNVSGFTIAANGALTAVPGSPFAAGSGAFGTTTDPSGRFLYVGNVFANNISGYSIAQSGPSAGALTPLAAQPFASGQYPSFLTAHSLPVPPVPVLGEWAWAALAVLLVAAARAALHARRGSTSS